MKLALEGQLLGDVHVADRMTDHRARFQRSSPVATDQTTLQTQLRAQDSLYA